MSAPIRVGGGYIEILPKLVGLDAFKRDLTARMDVVGREAVKSAAKAGTAEKAAAKTTVLAWTDAYDKMRFVVGKFDKLQQLRLKTYLGKVTEVNTTERKMIQATQTAQTLANKKRLENMAAVGKAEKFAASEALKTIKEQTAIRTKSHVEAIAQNKALDAARAKSNAEFIAYLKDESRAYKQAAKIKLDYLKDESRAYAQAAKIKLAYLKDESTAWKELTRRKLADIKALQVADANAIKQTIANYKIKQAEEARAFKVVQANAAKTLALQKGIADANSKAFIAGNSSAITKTTKAVEGTTRSLHGMASTLTQAGHALTFAFSGPLLLAAGFAVKTGIAFTDLKNRTEAAIAAFRGPEVAKGIVDTITLLSTQMPVAVEDMYQLAQRLSSLKTNAAPVTEEVMAFSRAIAAHHLSVTQSNRAMIQFQHIVMGYSVNAKELNTLTMDGIPAWDLLSRAMGVSVAKLKEMSKAGTLLSSEVTPKLVAFLNTNKEYADSIKASGESLQGAWIRLKNIFKVGLATDTNAKGVKGLAKALNDFSTELQHNMPAIQDFLAKVINWVTKLVHWIGLAIASFNNMPSSAKKATSSFLVFGIVLGPLLKIAGALTHVFGAVRILIGWLGRMRGAFAAVGLIAGESNPVGWIVTAIVAIGAAIFIAWKNSLAFRTQVGYLWTSLKGLFSTISASLGPVWGALKDAFKGSGDSLKGFGDYLSNWVKSLSNGIDWITKNWSVFGAGVVLGFKIWADVVGGVLQPTLSLLWDTVKALFGSISTITGAMFDFGGGAKSAASDTHGIVIAGGALGKTIVWLLTTFQGFGKVLVAAIAIGKMMAEAFVGLISILGQLGGLLIDVFSFKFLTDPSSLNKRIADVGGAIVGAFSGVMNASSGASKALGEMFNLGDLYSKNASAFNNIFDKINAGSNPNNQFSSVTPGSTPKDKATGGSQSDPNKSAKDKAAAAAKKRADAAAKAAAALAARIAAARDSLTNALKDFESSITGSASGINTATKALESKVTSAFNVLKKHDTGQKLVTYLRGVNKQLQALAKQRDIITKAIADNQAYRSTVTTGALDTAKITNSAPFSNSTAAGIEENLKNRLGKIKQFITVVKQLAAKGINKSLLTQVVDAGPIDGLVLGQTLLFADKQTWAAINAAQSQIEKTSKELGSTAGDMIFGSIATLQKKGKSLQDQMNKIAADAIAKVGKAFGLGWKTIKGITGNGITEVNNTMSSGLVKTQNSVGSTTANIKSSWSGMIKSMNAATGELVNVTYTKGVKGTVDAMAKIAGIKSPAGALHFSHGGTVPGYAPRQDTVPAMLSPGEGVMVPELTRQVGSQRLSAWNKAARLGGNVFAKGGVVNGYNWVMDHQNTPFKGYDEGLTAVLTSVVDPMLHKLAGMAGAFGVSTAGDEKAMFPAVHEWTKKLDKMANAGGNAASILKIAAGELGTTENPNGSNNTKYSPTPEQWCADFVSWVVNQSHANKAYFGMPVGGRWPAVNTWVAHGKHMPASQAQPGDAAYYTSGGRSHINLVEKNLGGGAIQAIGGNQGNAVTRGKYFPDGVLRPNLPKVNGVTVNPWPGTIPLGGAGGALGGGTFTGGGSPASNKVLGKKMNAAMGWGSMWPQLLSLWNQESGWNNNAENPGSHAFGIPQSLPWTKMPKAAWPNRAGGTADPATQMNWGLNYIRNRPGYGNPSKAWAHEQGFGWYDDGVWNLKRDQMAVVHAGEMIIPRTPATAIRNSLASRTSSGSGTTFNTTINAAPDVPTEQTFRRTLSYIDTMYGRG